MTHWAALQATLWQAFNRTLICLLQVLYMDAVQKLPEDVQDIVDLMTEKEIRLRAPLEEIELLLQA